MKNTKLINLLKKYRTIGVVGNADQAKTSLVLSELLEIKRVCPNVPIYIYGVSEKLHEYLTKKGITVLENREDILDLKIKEAIIYIDEIASFFSSKASNKQEEKLMRFFNRIYHLNDYLICSTAQQNYWNKTMEGVIKCFMVKKVDFDQLVRGTNLLRKVKGMEANSDYRLDIKINEYMILSDDITEKLNFKYNKNLDSKKDNIDIFAESEVEEELKDEPKNEMKDVFVESEVKDIFTESDSKQSLEDQRK